jgi:hypothetical protein
MECYEGATMIKTFRGLVASGAQDTIVLHTNDGSIGYRVVKFEIITNQPGNTSQDLVCKIWKVSQTTIPTTGATIDFSDNTMLGVGWFPQSTTYFSQHSIIIFDKEVFNQDIYITNTDNDGGDPCNYYLELEQVKLDINANTVATLKDMRNTASPRP